MNNCFICSGDNDRWIYYINDKKICLPCLNKLDIVQIKHDLNQNLPSDFVLVENSLEEVQEVLVVPEL